MESILIKIPANQDTAAEWVVIDHSGHPHAAIRSGPLSAAESHSQQRQVMALAPTTDLVINEVGFPTKNRRKLRQAVPYLLEEQLAEDVDDLHFAVGYFSQSDDEESNLTIPVATVQHEKMESWLAQFKASNISPKLLIPDVLALPYESDGWSILIKQDTSLIRTGENSGFACDNCNLQTILTASLDSLDEEAAKPEKLYIWDYSSDNEDEHFPLQCDMEIDYQSSDIDPINLMARGMRKNGKAGQALNLLQGDFSAQEGYGKMIRPWRSAAVLLASLIVITFAGNLIELFRLKDRERALFSEMQTIYKTSFPNAKNLSRPKLFMEQKLKELGVDNSSTSSQFFTYLSAISEMLPRHNATLKSISYNKQQLDVELEISNVQALDQLKNDLSSQYALSVDINAATPEDGKVNSRLRLKEADS